MERHLSQILTIEFHFLGGKNPSTSKICPVPRIIGATGERTGTGTLEFCLTTHMFVLEAGVNGKEKNERIFR